MGKWSGNKVNPENLNNGNEYELKDRVSRQQLNSIINSGIYSQNFAEHLADTPDVSEANNVGTPTVEIIDNVAGNKTYKKFKFKNLKGSTGEKGEKGEKGDTGPIGLTPNISVSASTLPTGSTATANRSGTNENPTIAFGIPKGETGKGYNPKGDWQSGIVYSNTDTDIDTVYYDGSTYYCKQTHTSSDSILPTNTTYWGLLSSVNILDPNYDTVIRTQSEFDTWVASVNAGIYLGKSVLIFGMGTPYVLNVDASTKKGIDLSNLGLTITGISNAEITIYIPTITDSTATVWGIYNSGSSSSTVGGLPKQTYSKLCDLTIRVYKQPNATLSLKNIYAIYKCDAENIRLYVSLSTESSIKNCLGMYNPQHLFNCLIKVDAYSSGYCVSGTTQAYACKCTLNLTTDLDGAVYNWAFDNCWKLVNCIATVSGASFNISGFRQCEDLVNCTSNVSSTQSGGAVGFEYCERVVNCKVGSSTNLLIDLHNCTTGASSAFGVGFIYISAFNVSPASFIGGTWEQLPEGYVLWTTTTSGQGGATISAGLPNINGTICGGDSDYRSGAFVSSVANGSKVGSGTAQFRTFTFNAQASNDIYGNSDTVQPPAIKVYAWKRTA